MTRPTLPTVIVLFAFLLPITTAGARDHTAKIGAGANQTARNDTMPPLPAPVPVSDSERTFRAGWWWVADPGSVYELDGRRDFAPLGIDRLKL